MSIITEDHITTLRDWGADQVDHPGGTLLAHLVRTAKDLENWGASDDLVLAALFHAAYGTDGFAPSLIDLSQRNLLQSIVGAEAEAIIYRYASCDRKATYPNIKVGEKVVFIDRYAGGPATMSDADIQTFVELTIANELDLVEHNDDFAAEFGPILFDIFSGWTHLASGHAVAKLNHLASNAPKTE